MLKQKLAWSVMLLMTVLFTRVAFPQVNSGTISGNVKDPSGAVSPGTKVAILNEQTGISRTVETNSSGHYSVVSLIPGNYRVTASHDGFKTEVRTSIGLAVGQEAIIDFSLSVGSVTQTVEVTTGAPLVDPTTSSLSSLVDDRTIRELPLNGRSYDQLALLQPGVVLTSPGATTSSTINYGSGKRFSVGGQRPETNSFLLDGTNINDQNNGTPGGAAGTNLGVDTILEFKIYTNLFNAEFGHSSGSVTSAVTRSGTNSLHGTVFEYIRNNVLDTKNYFDVGSSAPSFRRNQFGGVIGGPIKKDKAFFFAGYEGLRQALGNTLTATVPNANARLGILPTSPGSTTTMTVPVNPVMLPYLNIYPLPNGRDYGDGTAQYISAPTTVTNEDNAMGRVDYQINPKNSVFTRYVFDKDNLNIPQSIPTFTQLTTSKRQYTTVQMNNILSANKLNNMRFAFNRDNLYTAGVFLTGPASSLSFVPGEPMGSISVGSNSASGGTKALQPLGPTNGSGPNKWAYNIIEFGDDFSYLLGKHSFKFGTDIQRMQDNTQNAAQVQGAYTFATIPAFLNATASTFQVASPLGNAPHWGLRQSLFGFYAQDDFRVNSRVTINAGVRWESPSDPKDTGGKMAQLPTLAATATVPSSSFFHITKLNFEPRLGVAWSVNNSGTMVVHAGIGVYHNQIFPWLYWFAITTPPYFGKLTANNPPFPNGYQVATGALNTLELLAPVDKVPVAYQFNLSIQQQLGKSTVVQLSYAGNTGQHEQTQEEGDTPIPTYVGSNPFFPVGAPRRNTAWNGIRLLQTEGPSDYNSVTLLLRKQLSNGFQGQVFYTYSKALDEASGSAPSDSQRSPSAILNPDNPGRDWGLADFDSRHVVVGYASYAFPSRVESHIWRSVANGWTLDGIATFAAGQPFTPLLTSSVSRNLAAVFAERPNLVAGANENPTSGVSVGCSGLAAGTRVRRATNWYDPCSFSLPAAGTYGNLGRNTIIGPSVADIDLALEKKFNITKRVDTTFRVESFNAMNHTNLGLPNTTALAASGAANPSAGVITYTSTTSRQMQFALRINF